MNPLLLLSTTLTLAAAAATPLADVDLSPYERVDVAFENTGANPVTAATWGEGPRAGSDSITSNDATQATAVQAALVAGGKSVTVLTGDDVPARLVIGATSTLGTTVKVIVSARLRAAELFPAV